MFHNNKANKIIYGSWLTFIKNVILKMPNKQRLKKLFRFILTPVSSKIYLIKLDKIMNKGQMSKNAFFPIFKNYGDEFWFWLFIKGYYYRPDLRDIMPSMPEERLQLQFTGGSGYNTLKEAFSFYQFIKLTGKKYGVTLSPDSKILDFGCGWGRIIRFFLKDVNAKNLYGIDCDEEIIKICQTSNLNGNFQVNNIYPPTEFKDNFFDVIYTYSVFSHLSEEAHKIWLSEFKRILKPGGILIATTRDRDYIILCERLRKMAETDIPFFAKGLPNAFLNTSKYLTEYDNGKYIYEPTGGGGVREGSFYGETCIPEKYVKTEWKRYFRQISFINYKKHKSFNQNALIAQK
jgi:2-polyprenyl-3-methyl-5-hydroxy-6-metoxy-1,4-benzoquinol methylase